MDLSTHPKFDEGEEISWVDSEECVYSTAAQCTKMWDKLHIGTVSASKLTTWLGMSKFSEGPEESARQCVGLSVKTFNSEQLDRTQLGISGEPVLRDWYSKVIGKPIREVGIAVWKKDTRFRASLDGIYEDEDGTHGVEFKITDKIYWPLIQYYQARNRGFAMADDSQHSHIWDAHYNQMVQCMAVTGVKSIDYVVGGYKDNKVYIERVYPNMRHWTTNLYPMAVTFLKTYVEPLMVTNGIKRIDPHILTTDPPAMLTDSVTTS